MRDDDDMDPLGELPPRQPPPEQTNEGSAPASLPPEPTPPSEPTPPPQPASHQPAVATPPSLWDRIKAAVGR